MRLHGWILTGLLLLPISTRADEPLCLGKSIDAWFEVLEKQNARDALIHDDISPLSALMHARPDPASLPRLEARLNSPSAEVRQGAAIVIGRLGPAGNPAIPALVKALHDENFGVGGLAARALGRIGPAAKPAIPGLADALGKELSSALLPEVIQAIASIESDPMPIFLEHCKKIEDPRERLLFLEAISFLGEDAAPIVPTLLETLTNANEPGIEFESGWIFSRTGPTGKEAAQSLAKKGMVSALLSIDPESELTNQTIQKALADPNSRQSTAFALATFDPTSKLALPVIAEMVRTNGDAEAQGRGDFSFSLSFLLAEMDREGTVAVPALLATLKGEDADHLAWTIQALGYFKSQGPEIIPKLIPFLHGKESIRSDVVNSLCRFGPAAGAAIPDLKNLAKGTDAEAQRAALLALTVIAPDDPETVPLLMEAARAEQSSSAAALALARLGTKAKPAIPMLREMLNGSDGSDHVDAAYAFCRINENENANEGIDALIHYLEKINLDYCPLPYQSASAIARLGGSASRATPALVKLLETYPAPTVLLHEIAAIALGRIGPDAKDAAPVLKKRLETELGPLRDWYAIALSRIEPETVIDFLPPRSAQSPEDRHRRRIAEFVAIQETYVVPMELMGLSELIGGEMFPLMHGNIGVGYAAIPVALLPAHYGVRSGQSLYDAVVGWASTRNNPHTKATVPLLIDTLKSDDPFARTTAAYSLGLLGPLAKAAIPALRQAEGDSERSVRDWATRAIRRIEP